MATDVKLGPDSHGYGGGFLGLLLTGVLTASSRAIEDKQNIDIHTAQPEDEERKVTGTFGPIDQF